MESKIKYRKLEPSSAMYKFVQEMKAAGYWVCDSYDHNEDSGCSNPECFKHPSYDERVIKHGV